ncbi:PLD nuclease N-terminal domain-containing protein [Niallia sp. BSM11]|uniref:PLD nuclease N-terminal domain-containing protein n=1 Tax=Niallia sp. BSM11 TaxID=3391576 RepID=UPI0039855431
MNLHYGLNDIKDFDFFSILPIVLPFVFINFILIAIALIDLYRNRVNRQHLLIWTLLIIFINLFGPILYFVLSRKETNRV